MTDQALADLLPDELLIGGRWREGRGPTTASINPTDGTVNLEFRLASAEDVDEAVARAVRAQQESGWGSLLPYQRARHLYRIADAIETDLERLAAIQTADTGKTLAETRALVGSAAGTFRYMGAACETLDEDLTTPRGPYLTMSVWRPMGVVAGITPWNSPIASDAQKIAPALAAGNAVVLKPATWAPLVSLALGRLCSEAGLPTGLLSILPGRGGEVGDRIVRHPDVKKVSFTGGTATGRQVARSAADKLMPVTLELGGKSPTIVFDDAEVDHAVAGVVFGIFSSSGQSCIAGSRCFVQRGVYDRFVEDLVDATRALRVGDPTEDGVQVGPLVHLDHRETVERYIAQGLDDGAEVLCGARRPEGERYERGAFLLPTILAGVGNDSTVCREEIFGPVLVVLPFDGEDDLIRQANDSVYGLAAGVWTSDYRRAWRVARALEAGHVWINTYKQLSIAAPFGGMKDSGVGLEKGREGVRQYMRQQSLYWGLNPSPLPWASGGAPPAR